MKKTVTIAAAVALMVIGAQAAAVNWTSGNMNSQGWVAAGYGTGTAITYILGATPDGIIADLEGGMSLADAMTKYSLSADAVGEVGKAPAWGGNMFTGQAKQDFAPGDPATPGFAFAFNAAGDAFIHAENTSSIFNQQGTNAALSMTGLWMEYEIIPEPSSFALIGLGVAALALRRRVQK